MSDRVLPEPFQDLEPFVESWALTTETQRNQKRISSPMTEIQTFYDAMMPRMEAILAYLSQFPITNMPEDVATLPAEARRLLYLSMAMAEAAGAVEMYQHPSVIDGFDPQRFVPDHDATK